MPSQFIQLIMACVFTVKYRVCMNGDVIESFTPGSGIRKVDPLSPYLFVLCIEKLSHIVLEVVSNKRWKPIKASQSGPAVSRLFFADDLILFAEDSSNQTRVMKHCLDRFCQLLGQAVKFDKSVIFCSPNTCR